MQINVLGPIVPDELNKCTAKGIAPHLVDTVLDGEASEEAMRGAHRRVPKPVVRR